MDPQVALENWRAACAVIRAKGVDADDSLFYDEPSTIAQVRAERVREARADKREARGALCGWLARGGFEPSWASARERSYFIAD